MKNSLLLKKSTILFSIFILVISFLSIFFLPKLFRHDINAWYNASWTYRRPISVTGNGTSELTNVDVLIVLDTASLITASKLQSDCDDLRVVDSDDTSALIYWVEGGCNTSTTHIWTRIPSLPLGGKTIYVYYGNSGASNAEETWTGEFYVFKTSSCDSGWTTESDSGGDFYQRLVMAGTSYGSTGGSETHVHNSSTSGVISLTLDAPSGDTQQPKSGTDVYTSSTTHTHTTTITIDQTAQSNMPSYLDMIVCSNNDLVVKNDAVVPYYTTSDSDPSGFSRFTTINGAYVRGNSSYSGTVEGNSSLAHTHTISSGATTSTPTGTTVGCATGTSFTLPTSSHTHTISLNTSSASTLATYYFRFVQADSDIMAPAATTIASSAVPPLGWSNTYTSSYYLRDGSTYTLNSGGTTHYHITAHSTPSASVTCGSGSPKQLVHIMAHGHPISTNSASTEGYIPPYRTTYFVTKKASQATTVNSEETNAANNAPTFTSYSDNSPKDPGASITFSSVSSDTDGDDMFLLVCKTQGVTGTACDGGSGDTWCTGSLAASNASCSVNLPSVLPDGSYNAYPYLFDENDEPSTDSPQGALDTFSVNNVAPLISSVSINGGSPIDLTESTTKNVVLYAIVSDNNSCYGTEISTVYGYVYRTDIGYTGCDTSGEANNNYCYPEGACYLVGGTCTDNTDASVQYRCDIPVYYYADPTDSGTEYPLEAWKDTIKAIDDNSASGTGEVSAGVDINSLIAFSITSSINFGALEVEGKNDPLDKTTISTPTGNTGLDHELSGGSMCTDYPTCSGGTPITVGYQKYALAEFTSYSSGTSLTASAVTAYLNIPKPTSGTPATDTIWWGMLAPANTDLGVYNGSITVTGIKSDPLNW